MTEQTTQNDGRAYGHASPSFDSVLTQVGPGTPGGELLRRYWQPIALSSEATTTPRQIRRFGEELILFRTNDGQPGLLYPRCMHRGTSLLYGRVEAGGIRCCYHGWKYDPQGRCLDQPAEPDGGKFKDKVRQPWYPVVERYGLIFAYLGPAHKQPVPPLFSHMENLADDETISALYFADKGELGPFPVDYNWFQFFENIVDSFHVPILHASNSGDQFAQRKMGLFPTVTWYKNQAGDGVIADSRRDVPNTADEYRRLAEVLLPNRGCLPPFLTYGPSPELNFIIPLDDEHHVVIQLERHKKSVGPVDPKTILSIGPQGKPWNELTDTERRQYPSDYEAQRGQGVITFHSEEHLARSDIGIMLLRRLFKEQCEIVAKGGDPIGVAFNEDDAMVKVTSGSTLDKKLA